MIPPGCGQFSNRLLKTICGRTEKINAKITKKGAPAMKTYRHIAAVAAMLSAAPALADMTPAEQQSTLAAHNTERASYPGVGALMWAPLLA
jgi:hypothetical protein